MYSSQIPELKSKSPGDNDPLRLDAMAIFARRAGGRTSAENIELLVNEALPAIDQFLTGDRSEWVRSELIRTIPPLRDCLRSWADLIAPHRGVPEFSQYGPGYGLRLDLHAGAYLEIAWMALFPDSDEAKRELAKDPNIKFDDSLLQESLRFGRPYFEVAKAFPELLKAALGKAA